MTTDPVPDIAGRDLCDGGSLPRQVDRTEPGSVPEKREPDALTLALALVNGDRQEQYGEPADHAWRVAQVWRVVFPERAWTAADFCLAMECVKVVREAHAHKRDNVIDGAGWWEIIDRANGRA